jgi:mRNA-degrading endonuclease RelE of RelBE toxin-antitoxin system
MARILFNIRYAKSVRGELEELRAADRTRILDRIEEELAYQPSAATRNKKVLVGLDPPWEHDDPMWELRVGNYRVFYDVNDDEAIVTVRAVRHKPPHKTTEEII